MRKKDEKKPHKSKGKKIVQLILTALVVIILLLGFGYIYFEYNRLSYYNLSFQESWRGYLAYLIDFVPGLRNLSKYEYLEVTDPLFLEKEVLDIRFKSIKDERQELEKQKEDLEKLLAQISIESEQLINQKAELEKLNQEYQQKIAEYNDYQNRINTLSNWLARSTPQQIANALSREEVSVELLVDALAILEAKSAAEILQALAIVNPQKAAEVIAKMGEKRSE